MHNPPVSDLDVAGMSLVLLPLLLLTATSLADSWENTNRQGAIEKHAIGHFSRSLIIQLSPQQRARLDGRLLGTRDIGKGER